MTDTYSLGIDIGTSTLSAVVVNNADNECVETLNIPTDAAIESELSYEKIQDARKIYRLVKEIADDFIDRRQGIKSIGFSGQMHGIVYIGADNEPVSPLYTWQDGRAGYGSPSICEIIRNKTGFVISAGYGMATHYSILMGGKVPKGAVCLSTINDYCASRLCGIERYVSHPTDAASLGLYDITANRFNETALNVLGINKDVLPEIVTDRIIGSYRNIPVSVPLGDNQASFIGAVNDTKNAVLLNLGTGSQISTVTDSIPQARNEDIEVRPFINGKYLLCGSALCGGRAYAILEGFMRACGKLYDGADEKRYDMLNSCAVIALEEGRYPHIRTTFCGKRSAPDLTGAIENLTEENFTPGGFAAGVAYGMVEELYEIYNALQIEADKIILSGNAGRKNPAVRLAAKMLFGKEVIIPPVAEEAAYGAALYSAEQVRSIC